MRMNTSHLHSDDAVRPGSASTGNKIVDSLILVMLGTFAVTQPLLSDFRAGAGYFVARRNEPIEILLLVVLLTLAPGLIANLIVWLAGALSDTARGVAQSTFVGLFVALISHTTVVRLTSINWVGLLAASLLIGGLVGMAYRRSTWLRTYLTYLIPAPLIFALFFLLTPPVSGLVFPSKTPAVATDAESQAPVVFVVLDEFPVVSLLNLRGGIDAARYPNFAELASMSTWYKYTASAHVFTSFALPSLLSGEAPDVSLLPTAANYPGNLFTLLDRSHSLHVVEPYTSLCPPEACGQIQPTSLRDRFRWLVVDASKLYSMMIVPDRTASVSVSDPFNEFGEGPLQIDQGAPADHAGQFVEFLDGIKASDRTLHFVHLFLPHAPFSYYPSGRQYHGGGELDGHESEVWVEPVLADQGYQRHLLQVQAVDRMIGDLLATLDSVGILDEAVLVVTADHGISFRPNTPRRVITGENAYEVGLVPLFIKAPHQANGVVDTIPARSIDVLPTVADHLGIELPWAHDGQSLLRAPREAPPLVVHARGSDQVALDDVEQGVRESLADIESVFGDGQGGLELYSFGGYASLVGSPADDLATRSSGLTAKVDEAWRLVHVAPYTGFVPGFLHGHLAGEVDEGLHLAIAMNGVVRTVVPVFDINADGARFNAIIPDDAFVAGFNDFEVMAVSGQSDSPLVETIAVEESVRFRMEKAETGRVTRLIDSQGGTWPIVERSTVTGYVDGAGWPRSEYQSSSPADLYLHGWAIDRRSMKPVEGVIFFVDEVFAGSAGIDVERADNAEFFDSSDVLVSGFVGRLSHFFPSENMEVRAFALFDGDAHELPITDRAMSEILAG